MPLLYGEGAEAFRRLQEEILAKGEDSSLFAWGRFLDRSEGHGDVFAASPSGFRGCSGVRKGFATQRILFEATNRGIMVLIHRSYDRNTLDKLLQGVLPGIEGLDFVGFQEDLLGLTIPLSCFHITYGPNSGRMTEAYFLQLAFTGGRWRRVGVTWHFDANSQVQYRGSHYPAYAGDYVRLYIQHERRNQYSPKSTGASEAIRSRPIKYLHLRDAFER